MQRNAVTAGKLHELLNWQVTEFGGGFQRNLILPVEFNASSRVAAADRLSASNPAATTTPPGISTSPSAYSQGPPGRLARDSLPFHAQSRGALRDAVPRPESTSSPLRSERVVPAPIVLRVRFDTPSRARIAPGQTGFQALRARWASQAQPKSVCQRPSLDFPPPSKTSCQMSRPASNQRSARPVSFLSHVRTLLRSFQNIAAHSPGRLYPYASGVPVSTHATRQLPNSDGRRLSFGVECVSASVPLGPVLQPPQFFARRREYLAPVPLSPHVSSMGGCRRILQ